MESTLHEQQPASLDTLIDHANGIILGKDQVIRLALACLLARGHLLIEDLPGMGKTTLAHTLATLLGLRYQRVQFTSDLLPADLLGVSIYDRTSESFQFHPGPIFAQLVLADEINRATPKTQSALLEAMEEGQITVEGESRPLPEPFFVIATQNPMTQVGTFALPESQLDRFLMRIDLGYPDAAEERLLLKGQGGRALLSDIKAVADVNTLLDWQRLAMQTHVSDALLDYVQALIQATRHSPQLEQGLSPRAGQALLAAAKAWAWISGRPQVIPEDVQAVWSPVAAHRFVHREGVTAANALAQRILEEVAIP
ncbi:MAG: AAA family ATPase [bacterium]